MKRQEDNLQIDCVKWFNYQYPKFKNLLFHVPNGGKRGVVEATIFKRMGTVAGIPDLIFVYKGSIHAFELKAPKGVISKNQKEVHADWIKQGVYVSIIREMQDFIVEIKGIVKHENNIN